MTRWERFRFFGKLLYNAIRNRNKAERIKLYRFVEEEITTLKIWFYGWYYCKEPFFTKEQKEQEPVKKVELSSEQIKGLLGQLNEWISTSVSVSQIKGSERLIKLNMELNKENLRGDYESLNDFCAEWLPKAMIICVIGQMYCKSIVQGEKDLKSSPNRERDLIREWFLGKNESKKGKINEDTLTLDLKYIYEKNIKDISQKFYDFSLSEAPIKFRILFQFSSDPYFSESPNYQASLSKKLTLKDLNDPEATEFIASYLNGEIASFEENYSSVPKSIFTYELILFAPVPFKFVPVPFEKKRESLI
jgi:hypothetical protein